MEAYVGLNAGVLGGILGLQVDDIVDVEPKAVVLSDMANETALAFLVKNKAVVVADKAHVALVELHHIPLVSKLRKGVDNYTKKDVVQNNLDQQEERHVHKELDDELLGRFLIIHLVCVVTRTSTEQQTPVDHCHVALNHAFAFVLAESVGVQVVNAEVVSGFHYVEERDCRVDVKHNQHQAESHRQLIDVSGDSFCHIC